MSTIYYCAICNKETNYAVEQSTSCSECKKNFCSNLYHPECFHKHREECKKGMALTITNPQWMVNLVRNMDTENV